MVDLLARGFIVCIRWGLVPGFALADNSSALQDEDPDLSIYTEDGKQPSHRVAAVSKGPPPSLLQLVSELICCNNQGEARVVTPPSPPGVLIPWRCSSHERATPELRGRI